MKIDCMKQYGGALFTCLCPKCSKDLDMPKDLSVNRFMRQMGIKACPTIMATCEGCGGVEAQFMGFLVE